MATRHLSAAYVKPAMLRCCAGICGGAANAAQAKPPAAPELRPVVKPTVRLDEPEDTEPPSFERLIAKFGMQVAPPGVSPPVPAIVSGDFPRNPARLLVLLPSSGAPPGAWNGQDTAAPLLSWGEANGYATVLFSSRALEAAPAEVWDRILRGSPARFVAVVVADGALPLLREALLPSHVLLHARFRAVCAACSNGAGADAGGAQRSVQQLLSQGPPMPEELRRHLSSVLMRLPPGPAESDPRFWYQYLFELLQERDERWQRTEAKKYAGFQNLKENDMPGFRRMPVEKRIERLDRDRGNDELARLLRKHERQAAGTDHDSEDEPGID